MSPQLVAALLSPFWVTASEHEAQVCLSCQRRDIVKSVCIKSIAAHLCEAGKGGCGAACGIHLTGLSSLCRPLASSGCVCWA